MTDHLRLLLPLLLITSYTFKVSGSACTWKAIDCHRDEMVCNEKETILLDSKQSQSSGHCLGIQDEDHGKFSNYEIQVNLLSLESNEGQNSGYLGIAFNYLDEKNYDFVYLEYVGLIAIITNQCFTIQIHLSTKLNQA